jgi:hypothetical protein
MKPTMVVAGALALLVTLSPPVAAGEHTAADLHAADPTPPRLGYVHGDAWFWRPGAAEWVEARLNTPLAPGDLLVTESSGALELQVAPHGWVRAWGSTRLGLHSREPELTRIEVSAGQVSIDLHRLDAGHTVVLATPNAGVTITAPGHYRAIVTGEGTSLIVRRGGPATVTLASGQALAVGAGHVATVEGGDAPRVATHPAPPADDWDRWNDVRSAALLDSVSARHVSPGVYGIADLDRHGTWRTVETYGQVWVPAGVPAGWAPYSTGRWIWDPHYQWTWVDHAPWGWAPYHYGRWVFVNGYWAWTPGPIVSTPTYAPALVAFLTPRARIGIAIGAPAVSWVALGWGEPVIPWWGRPALVGVPRWTGWGGPRIVHRGYRNIHVRHAVVAVERDRFGRGPIRRVAGVDPAHLEPVRGRLGIIPQRASVPAGGVRRLPPPDPIRRWSAPPEAPEHRQPGVSASRPGRQLPASRIESRRTAPARDSTSAPPAAEQGQVGSPPQALPRSAPPSLRDGRPPGLSDRSQPPASHRGPRSGVPGRSLESRPERRGAGRALGTPSTAAGPATAPARDDHRPGVLPGVSAPPAGSEPSAGVRAPRPERPGSPSRGTGHVIGAPPATRPPAAVRQGGGDAGLRRPPGAPASRRAPAPRSQR